MSEIDYYGGLQPFRDGDLIRVQGWLTNPLTGIDETIKKWSDLGLIRFTEYGWTQSRISHRGDSDFFYTDANYVTYKHKLWRLEKRDRAHGDGKERRFVWEFRVVKPKK